MIKVDYNVKLIGAEATLLHRFEKHKALGFSVNVTNPEDELHLHQEIVA